MCRRGTSFRSSLGYSGGGLLCPCRPLPPTSDCPLPPRADEDFCCSAPAHFQNVPPLLAGSPAPSPGSSLLRTHDVHSCPYSFCQEGPFLPAAACFARLVPISLFREPHRPHPDRIRSSLLRFSQTSQCLASASATAACVVRSLSVRFGEGRSWRRFRVTVTRRTRRCVPLPKGCVCLSLRSWGGPGTQVGRTFRHTQIRLGGRLPGDSWMARTPPGALGREKVPPRHWTSPCSRGQRRSCSSVRPTFPRLGCPWFADREPDRVWSSNISSPDFMCPCQTGSGRSRQVDMRFAITQFCNHQPTASGPLVLGPRTWALWPEQVSLRAEESGAGLFRP